MARPRRIQIPGLIRHVMSRGNGRMRIFYDDVEYREFVYILGAVVEDYEIDCWNYCVMPNHYHATLQPNHANLSEAMRSLNSIYAQWWNHRHSRVGHVFQGRFKDQIVEQDHYLAALSRYVVLNPVRAGLVERPEEWSWSSYGATVGLTECPPFLSASSTLRLFGDSATEVLRARFADYVKTPYDADPLDDRIRSNEKVLGGAHFKAAIRGRSAADANGTPGGADREDGSPRTVTGCAGEARGQAQDA